MPSVKLIYKRVFISRDSDHVELNQRSKTRVLLVRKYVAVTFVQKLNIVSSVTQGLCKQIYVTHALQASNKFVLELTEFEIPEKLDIKKRCDISS